MRTNLVNLMLGFLVVVMFGLAGCGGGSNGGGSDSSSSFPAAKSNSYYPTAATDDQAVRFLGIK